MIGKRHATLLSPPALAGALLAMTAAIPAESAAAEARPNILIVLSDDQGWGDLSHSGNTNLATPNIDTLARDGASFDRFFVCPVCSPTRAEFLTGRYHPRGGVFGVSEGGERLDLDERTVADVFRAAGYATGAFGKWHNGMQYPYHPNGRGFDEYYGFCSGHWGDYFSPMLEHNGRIVTGEGYLVDDLTNHAMAFMEENVAEGKPFLAYLPYNIPHSPMQMPDEYWNRFKDKDLALRHRDPEKEDIIHTRAALAMCENIDWNVGRLLRKLDDLKIAENTIVLYFADNGPNGWRWNGGMKGRKGSTDEGGVRSAMFLRWPGHVAAGRDIPQIAGAIDLLPTLSELAGVDASGGKPLDGVSLAPLLAADDATAGDDWPNRTIFSHWARKVSARTQRFRLDNDGKLYDMVEDPGQDKDVAKKHPDIAAELRGQVKRWRGEVLAEMKPDEPRPFTIGHPDYEVTQIPARDGRGEGHIERSGKAPNCSFFRNWTAPADRIVWDAEVLATGDYEVKVWYACPAADVGSTIELSFNGAILTGKVTEAHDPPLRGMEHDRSDRGSESYVKDFKPMTLGAIHLEKGTGTLALRAPEIPGSQAMEFRLMMFERVKP